MTPSGVSAGDTMLELVATLAILTTAVPIFSWHEHLGEIFWVILAVIGGLARSLDGYVKSGVFPRVSMLVAHIAISGFAGFMMAQLLIKIAPGWEHIGAGVGGYLGTQGIDWMAQAIKARLVTCSLQQDNKGTAALQKEDDA